MKHDINTDVLKYYVYLVVQLATDVAYTSYMAPLITDGSLCGYLAKHVTWKIGEIEYQNK